MTLKEFSKKYDIPYPIVYQSSWRVKSDSPWLHDRDYPEEGLKQAVNELTDARIAKYSEMLENQKKIKERLG